jgi:hypothetical protein
MVVAVVQINSLVGQPLTFQLNGSVHLLPQRGLLQKIWRTQRGLQGLCFDAGLQAQFGLCTGQLPLPQVEGDQHASQCRYSNDNASPSGIPRLMLVLA